MSQLSTRVDVDLQRALFNPASVALIGASDDSAKVGARPLKFLRDSGWNGNLYPINPRRETVLGERAWSGLADLPEVPEHVFILTDSDLAVQAVRECAELGVSVATVMASGFAESGPEGIERQKILAEVVAGTDMRVLGPSSLGIVNPRNGLVLTANAAFAEPALAKGSTFVASQSGSVIGALVSRGKALGIGFAGLVSTGGEVDLSLGEICSATLDDPEITSYALFLESISGLEDLRKFSVEAAKRGKPVVAYKLGRSKQAAELAVSHTGALAGDDAIAAELLADMGIARVHTFEALLEAQDLARSVPLPSEAKRPSRVGVVTTTGGGGAMVVDQLAIAGVDVTAPTAETRRRLSEVGVDAGSSVLVDLTLAGTRYEVMKGALDVMLTAPEYDLVVAVAGSSARNQPELAVRPIADSANGTGAALAAFVVPDAPEALRLLHESGVPAFRTPESCADAASGVFSRRRPVNRGGSTFDTGLPSVVLDEAASADLLASVDMAMSPNTVLEVDAEVGELPFEWPVVVKALSSELPHKSDAGGVAVGVSSRDELISTMQSIQRDVHSHTGLTVERVIVQPMAQSLAEVLVGYRVDPDGGPIVMLASGGVTAELYGDRSLRPAPITHDEAFDMIGEVRALKLLDGYRGAPRGDLDALADSLVVMSQLATRDDLKVLEAEVNPLMVLPEGQGVLGVDGLVSVSRADDHA